MRFGFRNVVLSHESSRTVILGHHALWDHENVAALYPQFKPYVSFGK
jgi:hypothetical protein